MDRTTNSVKKFLEGYSCSQAILLEYCDLFNLDQETALRLAAGFGSGMCMGKTCGAVTGSYMVLGLRFGDQNCGKKEGRKNVYKEVVKFTTKFEDIYGSVNCNDLLGCDMNTSKGLKAAKDRKLFQTMCPKFVKTAAELLEKIIE